MIGHPQNIQICIMNAMIRKRSNIININSHHLELFIVYIIRHYTAGHDRDFTNLFCRFGIGLSVQRFADRQLAETEDFPRS